MRYAVADETVYGTDLPQVAAWGSSRRRALWAMGTQQHRR